MSFITNGNKTLKSNKVDSSMITQWNQCVCSCELGNVLHMTDESSNCFGRMPLFEWCDKISNFQWDKSLRVSKLDAKNTLSL